MYDFFFNLFVLICFELRLNEVSFIVDGRNDPVHMEMLLLLIHGGADVKCEHSQEFNGRDTCFYFNPLMYLYDRRPPDEGEEQGALAFLKVLLAYGMQS